RSPPCHQHVLRQSLPTPHMNGLPEPHRILPRVAVAELQRIVGVEPLDMDVVQTLPRRSRGPCSRTRTARKNERQTRQALTRDTAGRVRAAGQAARNQEINLEPWIAP